MMCEVFSRPAARRRSTVHCPPVAILVLGLVACGGEARAPARADSLPPPETMTAASATGEVTSGHWQDGDEQINWRAEHAGGAIARILESATFGTDGQLSRDLHFTTAGALRSFEESRTQTVQSPDRTPAPMRVRIAITFDADTVVRSEKLVDDRPAVLRAFEIDHARKHAQQILSVARRAP